MTHASTSVKTRIHMSFAVVLMLALGSCGGGGDGGGGRVDSLPPPPTSSTSLMDANDWEIGPVINGENYSHGVPLHPIQDAEGGWYIDLPQSDGVHYVTRPYGSLSGKTQIVIRYRVETADGVRIVPSTDPNLPSIGPTLYFQRAGDDWSTDGYRWWATFNAPMPIIAGEFEVRAPLNGAWTSVKTKTATTSPSEFEAAKAKASRVGFTLGGGTGYGHGVYATGQARIVVIDFRVE